MIVSDSSNPLVPAFWDFALALSLLVHSIALATALVVWSLFARRVRVSISQLLTLVVPVIGPIFFLHCVTDQIRKSPRSPGG